MNGTRNKVRVGWNKLQFKEKKCIDMYLVFVLGKLGGEDLETFLDSDSLL